MGTIQIDGSTPKLTIGNATAEDATILFDGNAQDYHIGLDDSADTLVLGLGSTLGTTPAMTVNSSQVVTFAQNPVFPDGSLALADLDIDGGTDIGADIVDADLFIIDDGAGGTNRKTTASRLKTYIGGSDPASADGDTLGTASAEWSDLYLADGGIVYFGNDQDITLTHNADTGLTLNGVMIATTVEPSADTSAGDNAAIGYTSTEGLILTGQGSTDDITIKNDADETVIQVATGARNVEITNGNLIIGTSGKGIDFSATSDGSGTDTSELLDDYEEGTWTPTISSGTVTNNGSKYTKIGCIVHWQTSVTSFTSVSDTTNTFFLGGLPYATGGAGGDYGGGDFLYYSGANFSSPLSDFGGPNSNLGYSKVYYHKINASAGDVMQDGDVVACGNMVASGWYQTAR